MIAVTQGFGKPPKTLRGLEDSARGQDGWARPLLIQSLFAATKQIIIDAFGRLDVAPSELPFAKALRPIDC